jgi:hypothetical protein
MYNYLGDTTLGAGEVFKGGGYFALGYELSADEIQA